jgi:hypothetical protein
MNSFSKGGVYGTRKTEQTDTLSQLADLGPIRPDVDSSDEKED